MTSSVKVLEMYMLYIQRELIYYLNFADVSIFVIRQRGDSLILFYNRLYDLSAYKILVSWKLTSRILYLILLDL